MRKKLTFFCLLLGTIFVLSSCGDANETDEAIVAESGDVTNNLNEELVGAFTDEDTSEIPGDAQAAFDQAYEGIDTVDIKLISYRGSQVVAGTNYKFLAEVDGEEQEIVVYQDLEGNCSFIDLEIPEPVVVDVDEDDEEESPAYTFTDMTATMYAKSTVNVRDLPDTVGNKIGSLSTNDEVQVTGQCNETGWYRITYKESTAYVSDAYLGTEKVEVTSPAESPSNGGESSNNGGGKVLVKIGDVPTPETEAWFYKHGWTYDASTDTFIPTEENKSDFYSYYGKTIAQIKAENNVKGITFCGPYLEQIFLDESYDDIVIGSYFARVYMPSYGHYLQAPF